MDIDTISLVQHRLRKRINQIKDQAFYGVDTMEKLQYARGQIRS